MKWAVSQRGAVGGVRQRGVEEYARSEKYGSSDISSDTAIMKGVKS